MKNIYLFLIISIVSFHAYSITIYVDQSATGSNSGVSWNDAFIDLQDAIALSSFGDEVWVAQGTYEPTTGTSRSSNFSIKNGTKIYGGFAGGETMLSQRDVNLNATILSGEIGAGTASDNSRIVVYFSNVANQTKLDGFIITGAYHDGVSAYGGGAKVVASSPVISNCTFQGNYAEDGGGALNHSTSGILTLEDCTFNGNVGNTYGGGALRLYTGTVNITNCYFKSNQSNTYGGAIYVYDAIVNISNSVFAGNMSQTSGSAIRMGDIGTLHMSNSLVVGNYTNQTGTITTSTFSNSGEHTIKNCTVAHNKHDNSGGSSTNSAISLNNEAMITNSIIYGNNSINQVLGTGLDFNHNITESSTNNATGTNISLTDPQFILAGDVNIAPFDTTGLNYHLDILSEGIDAGLNANVSGSVDLSNNARIYNNIVDLGAYEETYCVSTSQFTTPPPFVICGNNPIALSVDNGVNHQWSTGSVSNTINVSSSGNYSVIFEDVSGCRGNLTANVTSSPNPTPTITFSGGNLDAGSHSYYQWFFNGTIISGATNSTHVPIEGYGLYDVIVQNASGCEGSTSYCLSPAELNADGPTTFCDGESVTLSVTNGDNHVWSTGSLSTSITVNTTGIYSVTVANNTAGCSVELEQEVIVNPNPNPVISFNGQDFSTGTFNTYQWNIDGTPITGATSQNLDPTNTGNGQYTVTVTNSSGCEATSNVFNLDDLGIISENSLSIKCFPNPLNSGSNLTIELDESLNGLSYVELYSTSGVRILEAQISESHKTIHLPGLNSGLYFITIINSERVISGIKLIVL